MRRSELLAAANMLEHLGKLVLQTRQERELTQRQVTEQTGISQTTVVRVEHGGGVQQETIITLLRWMAE